MKSTCTLSIKYSPYFVTGILSVSNFLFTSDKTDTKINNKYLSKLIKNVYILYSNNQPRLLSNAFRADSTYKDTIQAIFVYDLT